MKVKEGPNPIRDRRPKDFANASYRSKCARLIQNLIRRFIAYRRVHRLRVRRTVLVSATRIQKVVRGFLGRRRFKRCKKTFKTETFFLRKQVMKRAESRGVVAEFIKKKVRACVRIFACLLVA